MKEEFMEVLVAQVGEFSSVEVLAEALKVSKASIYRAIESEKIVALHFGARLIVVTRSLEDALEALF